MMKLGRSPSLVRSHPWRQLANAAIKPALRVANDGAKLASSS